MDNKEVKNGIMFPYDFFKYCIDKGISRKGVCVVSSKQYVFYADVEDEFEYHYDIARTVEKAMVPVDTPQEMQDHAYVFAEERILMVMTPTSNEFGIPQMELLCKFLDEIKRINDEVPTKDKLSISFVNRLTGDMLETSDIERVKEELRGSVTKKMKVKDEVIIGETLSEDELKDAITKQIRGNFRLRREILADDYFGKLFRKTPSEKNGVEEVSRRRAR